MKIENREQEINDALRDEEPKPVKIVGEKKKKADEVIRELEDSVQVR